MDLRVINVIEEQISVQFTGKVNVLSTFNRQYLGHVLFKNGEVLQVIFNQQTGLKAFYHLVIQEFSLQKFDYVVEPEIVDEKERRIHYPYSMLKNKIADALRSYRDSLKYRPPENVRILVDVEFMSDSLEVTPQEFQVLESLTEWNTANDIYQHCPLLDYEITMALVSLRKKGALRILGSRNP